MLWIAVDVAVALLAVTGLALVCLRLWRQTKALGSTLSQAGERVGAASDSIPQVTRSTHET